MKAYLGNPIFVQGYNPQRWLLIEDGLRRIVCEQIEGSHEYSTLVSQSAPESKRRYRIHVEKEKTESEQPTEDLEFLLEQMRENGECKQIEMEPVEYDKLYTAAQELSRLHFLEGMLKYVAKFSWESAETWAGSLFPADKYFVELLCSIGKLNDPTRLVSVRAKILDRSKLFQDYFPEYTGSLEYEFQGS